MSYVNLLTERGNISKPDEYTLPKKTLEVNYAYFGSRHSMNINSDWHNN